MENSGDILLYICSVASLFFPDTVCKQLKFLLLESQFSQGTLLIIIIIYCFFFFLLWMLASANFTPSISQMSCNHETHGGVC